MATIATRLQSDGTYLVNGSFDEYTANVLRITTDTVSCGLLDEVTYADDNSFAKREDISNTIFVTNHFDEFTGAPVVDSSLVLWLDPGQNTSYSGTGTTVTDLSGQSNNVTLQNSPTFSSVLAGGSFSFNGSNQYGYISYTSSLAPTAGLTALCWAYLNDWTLSGAAYDKRMLSKTQSGGYNLAINDTPTYYGFVSAAVYISGAYVNVKYALSNLVPGWHCISVTSDGRYTILYVDAVARETNDRGSTGTIQYNVNNNFVYGAEAADGAGPSVAGGYWAGSLGPAMIYNRALTADEISQNFNALRRRYGI